MSLKLLRSHNFPSVFNDYMEPWNDWFHEGFKTKALTMPRVNITETKDSFNLDVAAPGLHKKDFKIDIEGNMLTISAQREQNTEDKDESVTRREYNYSSFSRSFTLPDAVVQEKISATYDGGVLKLTLPKTEKAIKSDSKTITVN